MMNFWVNVLDTILTEAGLLPQGAMSCSILACVFFGTIRTSKPLGQAMRDTPGGRGGSFHSSRVLLFSLMLLTSNRRRCSRVHSVWSNGYALHGLRLRLSRAPMELGK